uniref:UPF0568 protein C14orf166 homolog n=1 Tax=Cacopsylla melanoneura TaxID=428564 RepID=A0A8D8V7W9_9HEMI
MSYTNIIRKLKALGYASPESFNPIREKEFRNMVVWLEDQKIRIYKIEERAELRKLESPHWMNSFHQYCTDIGLPVTLLTTPLEQIEWLLGHASRLDYADNVEKYQSQTAESVSNSQSSAPKVVSTNPLDNLQFDSPEFKKGVASLAEKLKIRCHPDQLVTLEACCKLIAVRLHEDALAHPEFVIPQGKPFPFMDTDIGFNLGDPVLNKAAKILNLLYIQDLRSLQTKINEAIVAVQNVTANPKTDTKLGKVGF